MKPKFIFQKEIEPKHIALCKPLPALLRNKIEIV